MTAAEGASALRIVIFFITGGVIAWSGSSAGQAFAAFVTPIGTIWVNALRMTVVPLVASLLIATLASGNGARAFGQLGRRALAYYLALPYYQTAFSKAGFDPSDYENNGSDRLIDAIVAWAGKLPPRIQ